VIIMGTADPESPGGRRRPAPTREAPGSTWRALPGAGAGLFPYVDAQPEAPTMPLYEFHCRRCQRDFEIRQSLNEHEAHRPACPSCGARDIEPLLSPFFARTSHKAR
jgi:putative FmdB family regulatory protein